MPTPRKSRLRDGVQVLPNGKAKLRIWIGGKLIKRTLSHQAEAERVRDELRAKAIAVDLQIPQAPASPRFMSIGEVFDVFIREARDVRGRSPKYIAQLTLGSRAAPEERPRGLSISLDLEDLGPAVGEEQLGQLLRATFTDSKGTTTRDVFVPEPKPGDGDDE